MFIIWFVFTNQVIGLTLTPLNAHSQVYSWIIHFKTSKRGEYTCTRMSSDHVCPLWSHSNIIELILLTIVQYPWKSVNFHEPIRTKKQIRYQNWKIWIVLTLWMTVTIWICPIKALLLWLITYYIEHAVGYSTQVFVSSSTLWIESDVTRECIWVVDPCLGSSWYHVNSSVCRINKVEHMCDSSVVQR